MANLHGVYSLSIAEKIAENLVTRKSDYITIDVIPSTFREYLPLPEWRFRRIEFSVKVPFWRIFPFLEKEEPSVPIANVSYDPSVGVVYSDPRIDENII